MSPTARARRWPALAVIPAASGQRPADHLTHRPRNASRTPLRRHRRGAPAWAALSLLAGLLGLLALLSPVAAQSVTLVSNATKGSDASSNITGDRAQAFTTGAAGATLSSVEIISEDPEGDDVAVSLCMVDGSGYPTSDCTALTAPSSFAAGTLVFTAPANTTLAANTTYSLLVVSPGGSNLTLDATFSNSEDAGGATGWIIADDFDYKTGSNAWDANSSSASLRITIKGTITASVPTVATAILDQTATTGTAFDYMFPAATFTDADGDTLTYTATLDDNSALPSWLSFAPATRTFSGTPTAADVGTVSVKVTASDGDGGSVSDTFDIVVDLPTLVSNAGQGVNVAFGISQDRSQAFTTSAGATLSSVEIISEDNQGDDVAVSLCMVDGSNHPTSTCTVLTAPPSFAAGTLVFRAPANTPLAANTTYSLLVASPGGQVLTLGVTESDNENAGGATDWSIANVFDYKTSTVWTDNASSRALYITIKGTLSSSTNSAPTVATAIPDQTAMSGTAFSYQVPAATFTDADGDTLTYTATLADDTALPAWLSFAPATRTFSGTPTAAETVSVKVTASDGNGGSDSDTFDIVVSATADTTPPEVDSAELGASTTADNLVITFDENLDQTAVSIGLGSAFSVTADGQLIDISLISGFDATVTLRASLSAPAIRQGQTVVVGYTDPTAGDDTVALQDIAGNDVASFTTGMAGVPAVTNNSTSIAPTGAPTITGTAQVGETLTAVTTGIMDANGLTSPTYTYQWIRANGTDADIASANSSTYTLDAADLGKTIKVKVSFTDDTSNAETLTSAATATVTAYTLPAITITAGTSPVTEGTSAVFTLSRAGSTTAALTVNVTVSETGGDMVAASNEGDRTVTFLANAATATLSIATASDSVDEANSVVTATISADTGSPVSYSVGTPSSAMVTVEDNDTRDVTVSTTALPVNEGSTGTYTVVLNSQPTASVTVTPSRTGSSDVTFSPPTLTFTTSTWNTAQQVTVTAAQDSDAVDDSATISHAVTGGDYAAVTADSVVVTVDDDETADTTAPRVASIARQNPTSSPTNADSLTWRVTFSETVSNVDAADFAVSGTTATVTAVAAVSGLTGAYDVTASGGNLASVSATVTLTISSSHNIEDGASNDLSNTAPTGTNDNSYVVDNTAPSVTISGVPSASNAPFTATFTFSEAVTGFAVGDITLTNASVSNFTATSTTVYTALVTPTASGTVTVNVPANAAQDAAGNGNTAASLATTIYTPPAITITAGASPVTEGTSAVFTLSRAGSTTAALTVNVTVSETGGDMVAAANEGARTVAFLPNSATVTLSIATAADSVDEANSVVTATISADTESPASYSVGTPASAMVTVEDNDTRNVTVSPTALLVNEGSTGTYTVVLNSQPTASVTVTPSRTGSSDVTFSPPTLTFTTSTWSTVQTVTVTAAQDSDAVDDSATISHAVTGGDYAAVTADSVVVTVDDDETADTTAPRVASIVRETPTSSPTNADSLTWRVTFSETVSNVDAADFAVSGTTATVTAVATVSGVTGAYDVTASGGDLASVNATVALTISSSHNIQDGASNALNNTVPTGTNDNSYVVDNTAPTVTISGVPATSDAPFTATFTFSEAVTGFAVGDITLSNATASSFTVTSTVTVSGSTVTRTKVSTALVTPAAAGAVTVDVSANAAQDAAGNGNTAAARATSTYTGSATRGVTVSTAALTVNEGLPGTYAVVLDSQPTANVTVTPSRTGSTDVTFSPPTLTFTTSTWSTAQQVTVTAAQDSDAVDDSATISHAVTGGDYAAVTAESVVVRVNDDDTADTLPGVPTDLSASTGGNTQINLSWTAPTDDGGSPIIGYKIEVSPDGAADWTELVANTGNANTTYEHMGLTAGTSRHYRVSAINSVGTGDPSNIDAATTGPITGPITGGGGGGGGGGPSPSEVDFEWTVKHDIEALDGGNDWPTGLWSDGETLWIAENGQGADDEVYAYDRASGERLSEREFTLAEANRAPRGFWSDGSVVWVSDSGRERLFAYRLADGERLAEREFALAAGNSDARGIWSDGKTMWVLDGRADRLFAYALASGELLAEYALDSANSDPHGLWSDGVTAWVSDHGAKRLFAYRLEGEELTRNRDEEFGELSQASNNSPRGIWSDGDFMYVADESDDRVYTYNMPDGIDARLASLTLSGVEFGEFDPGRTDYEGTAGEGVTETTVEAEAMQRRTDVAIDPPDADGDDANGHQVALAGLAEITVTVTSADGSRKKVYRVQFPETGWDPARDPWPHCLRGAVSEGFSLAVHEGGSVEELVSCAESRDIVAFYALHEGAYAPYILGAPGFVNAGFLELFADGLPPITPLVAASNGPPSADPFGDLEDGGQQPWPECLRGAVSEGFSLVVYEGGSVEELEACAQSRDVTALYTLSEGEFVSYILDAPELVNQPFRDLFAGGLPSVTPLVARSEGQP